jgi:hypothetical protein
MLFFYEGHKNVLHKSHLMYICLQYFSADIKDVYPENIVDSYIAPLRAVILNI